MRNILDRRAQVLAELAGIVDAQYESVVNGRYMKSPFSNGHAGCLSFTVADGLISFQDDKPPPVDRGGSPSGLPAQSSASWGSSAKVPVG